MTWLRLIYHQIVYWTVGTTPEAHHWNLAFCWSALNRHERCIEHCEEFLKYEDSTYVRGLLGLSQAAMSDWEQAAATFRSVKDIWSHPELALTLAEAEMQIGNSEEARKIVVTIEVNHPTQMPHVAGTLEHLRKELGMAPAGEESPADAASRGSVL